jgi:hypothetical protein
VVDAPDLRRTWSVMVSKEADIPAIRDRIIWVLSMIEAPPAGLELDRPTGRRWHDHEDYEAIFRQLGIIRATPIGNPARWRG